jgi:excisionase family DNA binding protein
VTAAFVHAKPRYSLAEATVLLGISDRMLRERVQSGAIESHMDGDRRLISARAIDKYIAKAEAAAGMKAG